MKPILSPEQDAKYEATVNETLANPPEGMGALRYMGAEAIAVIKEVMKAGCWLEDELQAAGAPETERRALGFAHGQLCFGRDPWQMAVQVFDGYKAGQPVKPGFELANQIVAEMFTFRHEPKE